MGDECEHSTSSPAPAADSSPTSSSAIPQSEQLSLIPTAAESCGNEPPTDGSPSCACTSKTLGCSIHPNTPAEWIACMRDSLASLLALPENKKAQQMFAGNSLPRSSASWMPSDPNISFSKMYQDCSQADPRLAYVAGLIDGEGCIGIQKSSKHELYYTEVTIGMTAKALPVLMEMQKTFGGSLLKKRNKTDKWEEAHHWRIGGEGSASFLTKILPFLMLKRRQAELAISLEAMRKEKGWSNTKKQQAAKMKEQMHALNKKGPDAPNAAEGWYETEPDLFGMQNRLSGPFPRWGMTVGGQLYPLPMLALRTCVSGGGALQNVPTPSSNDWKGSSRGGQRRGQLTDPDMGALPAGGKLSPVWVCWLMGWPLNWMEVKK